MNLLNRPQLALPMKPLVALVVDLRHLEAFWDLPRSRTPLTKEFAPEVQSPLAKEFAPELQSPPRLDPHLEIAFLETHLLVLVLLHHLHLTRAFLYPETVLHRPNPYQGEVP